MKRMFAILAAVALLVTPAAVYACSVHGSIAANDFQNYLNGQTSNYGGGSLAGDFSSTQLANGDMNTSDWSVWGTQGGSGNARTYTLVVTTPDGSTISWETSWGELPDGYLIEWALTNAAQDWFQTQFDEDGNLVTNSEGVVGDQDYHIDSYQG